MCQLCAQSRRIRSRAACPQVMRSPTVGSYASIPVIVITECFLGKCHVLVTPHLPGGSGVMVIIYGLPAVIINTWLLWLRAKDPSWRDTGELMAKVSQAARGADGSACRPGGGAPSSQSSDVGKHCGVALPRLRGSDTLLCLERGGIFDSMQKGTFTLSYLSLPKVKKSHLTGSLWEDPLKHWYLQAKNFE